MSGLKTVDEIESYFRKMNETFPEKNAHNYQMMLGITIIIEIITQFKIIIITIIKININGKMIDAETNIIVIK